MTLTFQCQGQISNFILSNAEPFFLKAHNHHNLYVYV
jgi:hypothetical protein